MATILGTVIQAACRSDFPQKPTPLNGVALPGIKTRPSSIGMRVKREGGLRIVWLPPQ